MNKRIAAAHVGVPFMVVVGGSLATLAVIGTGPYRPEAASPPRPRSTVTVTQPPVSAPAATRTLTPSPSTSGPSPAATVQPVSDRRAASSRTSSGGQSHAQARPPSTSQSSPAAPCSGVLSVRLLRAACVKIGGGQ